MAIIKITELPAATSPVSPSDVAPVVQNGVTKKAALSQLGYAQSYATSQTRTMQDKLRESVSVKDFGAVGDGVTDDTSAIQAAVNALFPAMNNFAKAPALHFPAGNYLISSGIIINSQLVNPAGQSPIHIYGDGIFSTTITAKAGSAINAMFEFRGPVAGSSTWETTIRDMDIQCGDNANYGIAGFTDARVPYLQLTNVFIRDPLIDGISIRDAYGMIFQHVTVRGAGRDGFALYNGSVGQNNGALLNNCLAWVCDRFGMYIQDCYAVHLNTCVIEGNPGGGVYIGPSQSVFVDNCYFEANASTGHTFSSPTSFSVKSDIIINGSANTSTISQAFPTNVTVSTSFTSPSTGQDCFIFANGANGLVVENNKHNSSSAVVLDAVRYFGSVNVSPGAPGNGYPTNLSIRNNINFSKEINIVNFPYLALSYFDAPLNVLIDKAQKQNIAQIDFNQWILISASGAATWRRSATVFPFNNLVPVWEIDFSTSGSSDFYGFQINATNVPQYHNKLMVFGAWVKKNLAGATSNAVLFANGSVDTDSYSSNTNWQFKTIVFSMPTSGTVSFALNVISNAAETVQISAPVLCELGADVKSLYGAIGNQIQFSGTAAPTAGTWKRGDIVLNSTPSAGNTPGWICVTAGAPGTWKAMANVAA